MSATRQWRRLVPLAWLVALAAGEATITAINGAFQATIQVMVVVPATGNVNIGSGGGIVAASDGSTITVPPSLLQSGAMVSVAPVTEQQLAVPVPPDLTFAGAVAIGSTQETDSGSLMASIAAPGVSPGQTVYFMEQGSVPDATGAEQPTWLLVGSGTVGTDGFASMSTAMNSGIQLAATTSASSSPGAHEAIHPAVSNVGKALEIMAAYATNDANDLVLQKAILNGQFDAQSISLALQTEVSNEIANTIADTFFASLPGVSSLPFAPSLTNVAQDLTQTNVNVALTTYD